MAESRKLLVAFDPDKPERQSSDFLVVVENGARNLMLFGTHSRKAVPYGLVIVTSRAVTENDLFAKLVDSGREVPSVDKALATLRRLLSLLTVVRVGSVVEIRGRDEEGWELSIVAPTPSGFARRTKK